MQSLHNDVKLYIYLLIHESRMKKLNQEYHSLYGSALDYSLYLKSKGLVVANYRYFDTSWIHNRLIFGCSVNSNSVCRRQYYKKTIEIPKRYHFSSGMDSLEGYK